ncbi:gyhfK, partial [Escherichia coli]|nr:gyhfK [Escherichia coli]
MQKLRLVKVGFTITAVYTLQLLWLNGEQYILPCL